MPAKTLKNEAPAAKPAAKAKAPAARQSLAETMTQLEKAGSEQTRKTYARHGVTQPMFGVSFATLKTMMKRIRIDHDLACALWDTGNFDAQNLAVKVVDPGRMTPSDLDRWARGPQPRIYAGYVASLTAETPHARGRADKWLASKSEAERNVGWGVVGMMAMRDVSTPESWFAERLAGIERGIRSAPNDERYAMNGALIAIGGRNAALRKSALAAAKRIGKVEVDHGDTACKTPDAVETIEKMWAYAASKGFESPAAQERERESMRTRC
jgi:3-methyladenine DNA glycosylase AlkD